MRLFARTKLNNCQLKKLGRVDLLNVRTSGTFFRSSSKPYLALDPLPQNRGDVLSNKVPYQRRMISFVTLQGNFSTFLFAMGKILVMMIGELDYTDILVVDWSNKATVPLPMITIGLFFLFVLTVSVVLVNLLVGTAKLLLSRRETLIETLCTDDILK